VRGQFVCRDIEGGAGDDGDIFIFGGVIDSLFPYELKRVV
jgi:hypothetical protein